MIRVIRLVRLIRIIKLYKQIQQQRQKREEEAKKAAEAGAVRAVRNRGVVYMPTNGTIGLLAHPKRALNTQQDKSYVITYV